MHRDPIGKKNFGSSKKLWKASFRPETEEVNVTIPTCYVDDDDDEEREERGDIEFPSSGHEV